MNRRGVVAMRTAVAVAKVHHVPTRRHSSPTRASYRGRMAVVEPRGWSLTAGLRCHMVYNFSGAIQEIREYIVIEESCQQINLRLGALCVTVAASSPASTQVIPALRSNKAVVSAAGLRQAALFIPNTI